MVNPAFTRLIDLYLKDLPPDSTTLGRLKMAPRSILPGQEDHLLTFNWGKAKSSKVRLHTYDVNLQCLTM